MTADEFAAKFAEGSRITVEELKERGREPRPCDCGGSYCSGWRMAYVNDEVMDALQRGE
jgi:hypothetical protein